MPTDITVLCSMGRHPGSGRSRCAIADIQALACALATDAHVRAVHAGDPQAPGLRDYLGQTLAGRSLETLDVIDVSAGCDIRPALMDYLRVQKPDIVLAGMSGECGESSGMLAYDLSHALDYAMVANLGSLSIEKPDSYALTQILPRGRRRALAAKGPLIATVSSSGFGTRPIFAHARAQRGQLRCLTSAVACPKCVKPTMRPARVRPKRLKIERGSAAERLHAASETQAGRAQLMVNPSAEEAACAIADYLRSEGLWPGGDEDA